MNYPAWAIAALLCAIIVVSAWGASAGKRKRAGALDTEAMLWALRQVETGENPKAIGPFGERSAYQFLPSTWAEYTDAKFEQWASSDAPLVHRVAKRHLARICAALFREQQLAEPAMIAAAWRYGIGNAVRCARTDYSRRTANLYWDRVASNAGGSSQ
jgi:hypothetical protein